jgi:hypothetical protein
MHVGEGDPLGHEPASSSSDGASITPEVTPEDESAGGTERPSEPAAPVLPKTEAKSPPSMMATVEPTRGAESWYRSDQDRFRSVHRRANPWYRRLARGVIGLSFLAAAGIGLFYAARLVQDYLDRDRLPSQGAEVPVIRATSFELRSTAPAPALDGTLTLDAATKAFEFVGRGTGPLAGTEIVSPDGSTTYVRIGSGSWERAVAGDQVVSDVVRAVAYLADDDSADDILTSHLRRGYVDLLERTEIGTDDDEVRQYELRLDTRSFAADFPLQYQQFEERALPGVQSVRGLLVTITLDDDDVLVGVGVGVDDAGTNWSWQRLTYDGQPFVPFDPADELLGNTIEVTDGALSDG